MARVSFRSLRLALALMGLGASASIAQGQTGRLVAIDSSRAIYEIDMSTGAKTLIGTASSNAGTTAALAFNCASQTLYLASTGNDSLYTLDITTGTATLIGAFGDAAVVMHGLEWDNSTNTLYGYSSHNGGLYNINPATGAATLIGTSGLTSFGNLGYDSAHDQMYVTNSTTDSLYTIDRTNGSVTLLGAINPSVGINPQGMAYNWHTDTLFLAETTGDNLYTLDRATGQGTIVGSTGAGNLLGLVYLSTDCGGAHCPADLDDDGDFANGPNPNGAVEVNDLLYFVVGFEEGSLTVDLDNGSGTGTPDQAVDVNDLLYFLVRFEAGC